MVRSTLNFRKCFAFRWPRCSTSYKHKVFDYMTHSFRNLRLILSTLVITATGFIQGNADIDNSVEATNWSSQRPDWSSQQSDWPAQQPNWSPPQQSNWASEQSDCSSQQPLSCCPSSCGQFLIEAEVLCLRAFQEGLASACDNPQIHNFKRHGNFISKIKGTARDPNFKWNFGYRLGVGYKLADNNSIIGVRWLHFNTHSRKDRGHRDRSRSTQHNWKIDFDVVDFLYGYGCELSNNFVLIPFVGIRYARIDQKLRTDFVSRLVESTHHVTHVDQARSRGRLKQDFYGVGPILGFGGDWDVGCGLGIYGDASVSMLYGSVTARSELIDVFNTATSISHLRKHTQTFQTVLDARVGVRWRTCFCNNRVFVLRLGLEDHRYFNHNYLCGNGGLDVCGLSFGFDLEY